jgi:ParB family chromosome partitioning protein
MNQTSSSTVQRDAALKATFDETQALTDLIGQRPDTGPEQVPLEQVVPNQFNPRQAYPQETLEELAASMREHGFLGALDGRRLPDGRVEAAYGASRILAARRASLTALPFYIHDWDDTRMLEVALVENAIRSDLTPLETAEALTVYQSMLRQQVEQRKAQGGKGSKREYSARSIARRLGKHRNWVADHLTLSQSPADVRDMVRQRPDTLRIASHLQRIEKAEDRERIEGLVTERSLTTRQVQVAVQHLQDGSTLDDALAASVRPTEHAQPPSPEPAQQARGTELAEEADEKPKEGEKTDKEMAARAAISTRERKRSLESSILLKVLTLMNEFDASAVEFEEIEDMLTWLAQIDQRAWSLKQRLDARMTQQSLSALKDASERAATTEEGTEKAK